MPDWQKLLDQLSIVIIAPVPFAIAVLISAVTVWTIISFAYKVVLEGKKAQIEVLDRQIADLKDRLNEAFKSKQADLLPKSEQPLAPLDKVIGRYFKNERVPLDGFEYNRCTFDNVTLVYNGGPVTMTYNTFRGFVLTSEKP